MEDVGLTGELDALCVTNEGCTDELVLHSWIPNTDGSITVWGIVNFYGPNKQVWSSQTVKLRLKAEDTETRKYTRQRRREVLGET